eukprot:CAMPEP_0173426012 /NCGR_PEP_ID=MMETSP1357-20121228/5590_1 /TAXON_ID=77926 /ORGANISM="Hemiselmis rufescens, Strain PCC563" /LENGTH=107 /DNA_ID=CAMNT_0014389579 /DNA_START=187 /DNA_END=507 /DNA_ORIENTATION=+
MNKKCNFCGASYRKKSVGLQQFAADVPAALADLNLQVGGTNWWCKECRCTHTRAVAAYREKQGVAKNPTQGQANGSPKRAREESEYGGSTPQTVAKRPKQAAVGSGT